MIKTPKAIIAGIGTDIIYIERIRKVYERHGERFIQRILGPQEQVRFARRYARDPHRGITFLATRFAAKEAFSKAIGLGMRMPMRWSAMQTLNAPSGKPMVVLDEALGAWYEARFGAAHVSLTDESDLAMATVIVEARAVDEARPTDESGPTDEAHASDKAHRTDEAPPADKARATDEARSKDVSSPVGRSAQIRAPLKPRGPVMVDIEGLTLAPHEIERLRHPLVGAVILFARNYESPAQLSALCEQIHAVRDEPLLIAIDHEGGRVQRCRTGGFTALPAMRRLGQLWAQDPERAKVVAKAVGYVLAAELRACEVDFSFTPVLDLDYGASEVIGDRAFDRDPQVVSVLAQALMDGLAEAGMAACGKHFPGHGYVEADSHVAIPRDEREFEAIWRDDIEPYRALGERLASVMPAHVIYPKVDALPAGFSPFWVQQVLRQQLNYQGMVFSDDLTMEGASVVGGIVARAEAAFKAGCDMVLVCNRPDLADELLATLTVLPGPEYLARLARLCPTTTAVSWDALPQCPRYQEAKQLLATLDGLAT